MRHVSRNLFIFGNSQKYVIFSLPIFQIFLEKIIPFIEKQTHIYARVCLLEQLLFPGYLMLGCNLTQEFLQLAYAEYCLKFAMSFILR